MDDQWIDLSGKCTADRQREEEIEESLTAEK